MDTKAETNRVVARLAGAAVGVAIAVLVVPFLFIAAVNDLFDTTIRHQFWNYLSFWVLYGVVKTAFAPVHIRR